ncbi:MAG TPA: transporter substrate-binding domain-containing protein, partial [Mariprofundaceae bacterium]|nr:transporter substrate-binding domain-containing protein [Mariprofundaceae bacterium]
MDCSLALSGMGRHLHGWRGWILALCLVLLFPASAFAAFSSTKASLQIHSIHLTQQERLWLKQHPVIRFGIDADFPPYEFVNPYNRHAGVSSDYLKLLSGALGVRFERVPGMGWSEMLSGVRDKQIDLLPLVTSSP